VLSGVKASDIDEVVRLIRQSKTREEAIEKLKVRRSGMGLYVDLHVQADPALSLHDAHILSGVVKSAIRRDVPTAVGVLIHMEPYQPASVN
jgi:divalent metal cation (Fe/Co/Zn/Cd) transporter